MSNPILLFLTVDVGALLLMGALARFVPASVCVRVAAGLLGLGTLSCLLAFLVRLPTTGLSLPIGPPGLSMHLVLNPLTALFLLLVLLAGSIIAAVQATVISATESSLARAVTWCVGGASLSLLAADGVTLAIGLIITCGAMVPSGAGQHRLGLVLVPALTLIGVCLLTPVGYAVRFELIRAAALDFDRATVAAVLIVAAAAALIWVRIDQRCWTRATLMAGVLTPLGCYLMLRMISDLSGSAITAWWGLLLLLAGGWVAVLQGWRSAAHPELDRVLAALMRRQFGLAMTGIGLALIARAADLPEAAVFALKASCLSAIGAGIAGTLMSLAIHTIGASAGTYRLSRLGGLGQTMPVTSAAAAAGLLTLSALPPGLGFAALWLSFQSILLAPRTGGLPSLVPIALAAGAIALSAALSTAASIRVVGIAILGRPRTPQAAGAIESRKSIRTILLATSGIALLMGLLPGPVLGLLVEPAIQRMTGLESDRHSGVALLSASSVSPGYLALPIFTLFVLATAAVVIASRRSQKEPKAAGAWTDGMPPPSGLPFGEPAAQSASMGFLPTLPDVSMPRLPRVKLPTIGWPPPATTGLWLMLLAFAALLLIAAVTQ